MAPGSYFICCSLLKIDFSITDSCTEKFWIRASSWFFYEIEEQNLDVWLSQLCNNPRSFVFWVRVVSGGEGGGGLKTPELDFQKHFDVKKISIIAAWTYVFAIRLYMKYCLRRRLEDFPQEVRFEFLICVCI